jgi:hypothetical protein
LNLIATAPLFFKRDYFGMILVRVNRLLAREHSESAQRNLICTQENIATMLNIAISITAILLEFCFPATIAWWTLSTPIHIIVGDVSLGIQPIITLGFPILLHYWRKVPRSNV